MCQNMMVRYSEAKTYSNTTINSNLLAIIPVITSYIRIIAL